MSLVRFRPQALQLARTSEAQWTAKSAGLHCFSARPGSEQARFQPVHPVQGVRANPEVLLRMCYSGRTQPDRARAARPARAPRRQAGPRRAPSRRRAAPAAAGVDPLQHAVSGARDGPEDRRREGQSREPLDGCPTLPDILAPGLSVVFVGINPSLASARAGHHFASPGNPFWRLLHASRFTPALLRPVDDARLIELGLGLTNVCPNPKRSAAELTRLLRSFIGRPRSPARTQLASRRARRARATSPRRSV